MFTFAAFVIILMLLSIVAVLLAGGLLWSLVRALVKLRRGGRRSTTVP